MRSRGARPNAGGTANPRRPLSDASAPLPAVVSAQFGHSWWTCEPGTHAPSAGGGYSVETCAFPSCCPTRRNWPLRADGKSLYYTRVRLCWCSSHAISRWNRRVLARRSPPMPSTQASCRVTAGSSTCQGIRRSFPMLKSPVPNGRRGWMLRFLPQDFHNCGKHCGKRDPGSELANLLSFLGLFRDADPKAQSLSAVFLLPRQTSSVVLPGYQRLRLSRIFT
jgi:hypothetical protein